jgi:molecular chaperone DnaJ
LLILKKSIKLVRMSDYYDILGVSKEASDADIKRAYRKKAQEFHPDKNNGDTGAEKKFKEVQEAYEVLSDQQKRSAYDQFGKGGSPFGAGGTGGAGFDPNQFGGFADIFESFFGGGFGGGQQGPKKAGPMRGSDIETEIEISFEEAVFGSTKHLELTKPEICPDCKGSGNEPGTKIVKCGECGGSGQVKTVRQTILGQISSVQTCPRCLGAGEVPEEKCKKCGGQTRVRIKQEVSVKIPKGIEDGVTIRLSGKGSAGVRGGKHGDLFLHIRVAPHAKFSREGQSIYSHEEIKLLQAVLGAEVRIDTIHGKETLKIPAGTQNGTEFVLKGKGAPSIRSEKLGDHKVTIYVKVPDKLSKKERELYETLAVESGVDVKTGGFSLF